METSKTLVEQRDYYYAQMMEAQDKMRNAEFINHNKFQRWEYECIILETKLIHTLNLI
jgi:hypothetical protein